MHWSYESQLTKLEIQHIYNSIYQEVVVFQQCSLGSIREQWIDSAVKKGICSMISGVLWYALGPFIFSRATPKVATTHKVIASDHGGTPSSVMPFQNRHNSSDIISACWWDSVTSLSCFLNHWVKRDIVILENTIPIKTEIHHGVKELHYITVMKPPEAFTSRRKKRVPLCWISLHLPWKDNTIVLYRKNEQKSNFKTPL